MHTDGDLASHGIPHDHPPHYDNLGWDDEAPAYENRTETTAAPQLPNLTLLPSIEITAAMSPVDRSPTVPSAARRS
jgi:hypothetical protein